MALFRADKDAGVGDTIARNLGRLGADYMKRAYQWAFGADCGCGARQARLNALYPYPTVPSPA